jgi:hypothetical protein
MSASYTRQDRVLSVREREKFRNEIRDRERALQGQLVVPHVNGSGPEGMSVRRAGRWNSFMDPAIQEDAAMIRSQIRHLKNSLDKGSPRSLSRKERAELEKQVAEDRSYLKKNMTSQSLYYKRSSDLDFAKATQAVLKNEVGNPEFQRRVNRFKNNMRELDPDNPDSSNIEKFRPKK